jgi:hypothetical protein
MPDALDALVDDAVARAVADVRPEPSDRSFLEKRLAAVLAAELAAATGRTVTENKKLPGIELPDWSPQPGWIDIAVLNKGGSPWITIEIKLDDVDQTLWDIHKMASASRLSSVEAAYVVAGAPERTWHSGLACTELYTPASQATTWSSGALFGQHKAAWTKLLRGGRGRPTRVPATIRLTPLAAHAVLAFPRYEVRPLRVESVEDGGWLKLAGGWPADQTEPGTDA